MTEFLLKFYPWIMALHIMAVISWMAGIFYLPRLFVYHVERGKGDAKAEDMFQTMERKLLRGIMNPAMIVTWICGLLMVWAGGRAIYAEPWFIMKFVLVCIMTWFHHWCGLERKRLAKGEFAHDGRYYRLMNEVPTLLMIGIVLLVVLEPF